MELVRAEAKVLAASGREDRGKWGLPHSYGNPLELLEVAGRTCYKSEDKAWKECPECGGGGLVAMPDGEGVCGTCKGGAYPTSAHKFVSMLEKRGHYAMLEHGWLYKLLPSGVSRPPTTRPGLAHNGWHGGDRLLVGNPRALMLATGMSLAEVMGMEDATNGILGARDPWTVLDIGRGGFWHNLHLHAMTAKVVCDRGVTHEIVRHRLASYAQESTRYCNYKGGVKYVIPPWVHLDPGEYTTEPAEVTGEVRSWVSSLLGAAMAYHELIGWGQSPQQARSVLPNSTKTEIIITASLREWQHIFRLRCHEAAHPQMREVMLPLWEEAKRIYPGLFDSLELGPHAAHAADLAD